MNRPTEQFSKKVGRMIAKGRMESTNSLLVVHLKTVRKVDRREEILQFIADPESEWFVDPLISRVMHEGLWYRNVLEEIFTSLNKWEMEDVFEDDFPILGPCDVPIPGVNY